MNVPVFILSAISDIVLLFAQTFLLSGITGRHPVKPKVIISCAAVILTDFLFELSFFETFAFLQWIAVVINSIKVCALTLYTLHTFRFCHILIALTVQFTCSVLSAGMTTVLYFNDNSLPANILTLFAVRFLLLASSLIIYKRHKNFLMKDKSEIIPNHIYILILIVLFIETGIIHNLSHTTSNVELKISISEFLVMILIVFTTVLIISLAVNTARGKNYLMINAALEQQNKIQLAHYEKMEQVNMEIRRFRHDYSNHINCIANMIKGGKNEETLKYIKKMSDIVPAEKILIKTGNYIADAILSDKQDEAEKYNTRIKFDGIIPCEINSTDLCIILSNALDNAVEACSKISDEKTISVYGNFQQGCVVLIIKNPAIINWDKSGELPPSSKEDNKNHGWGLLNIQRAVKKYDGNMNISASDNMFVLSISFNPKISNT